MKNPQAHLPDEKAQKELKQFLVVGWILAVIAYFLFGWLAIASVACGARCIALSWHQGNADRPNGALLKTASILLVIASVIELVAMRSQ